MDTKNLKIQTKIQTEYKSTELISILAQNFSGKMNLARIKFFGLFMSVHGRNCVPLFSGFS